MLLKVVKEPQIAQLGVQRPLACDLVSVIHFLPLAASFGASKVPCCFERAPICRGMTRKCDSGTGRLSQAENWHSCVVEASGVRGVGVKVFPTFHFASTRVAPAHV
jgi:hypothetical protein